MTSEFDGFFTEEYRFLETQLTASYPTYDIIIGGKYIGSLTAESISIIPLKATRDPNISRVGWKIPMDIVLLKWGEDAMPEDLMDLMEPLLDNLRTYYDARETAGKGVAMIIDAADMGFVHDPEGGFVNWISSTITVQKLRIDDALYR